MSAARKASRSEKVRSYRRRPDRSPDLIARWQKRNEPEVVEAMTELAMDPMVAEDLDEAARDAEKERLYARPVIEIWDDCDCACKTRPCSHVGVWLPHTMRRAMMERAALVSPDGMTEWETIQAFYVEADANAFYEALVRGDDQVSVFHDIPTRGWAEVGQDCMEYAIYRMLIDGCALDKQYPRWDVRARLVKNWVDDSSNPRHVSQAWLEESIESLRQASAAYREAKWNSKKVSK